MSGWPGVELIKRPGTAPTTMVAANSWGVKMLDRRIGRSSVAWLEFAVTVWVVGIVAGGAPDAVRSCRTARVAIVETVTDAALVARCLDALLLRPWLAYLLGQKPAARGTCNRLDH